MHGENGYSFQNPNLMFKAPAHGTSLPEQSLQPSHAGASPPTQSNSSPMQDTRPRLQGTRPPTQGTSSPMQSFSPLMQGISQTSHSKPQLKAHFVPEQSLQPSHTGCQPSHTGQQSSHARHQTFLIEHPPSHAEHRLSHVDLHPSPLPPNQGHPFCYTYDRNVASMSDIVKGTVKPQRPSGNLT